MNWQDLVAQRRVAAEPAGRDELAALGHLVNRCLADAVVEGLSPDGRFERAYAAARTLATIVVRAEGYRVRQPGAHHSTFLALEAADRDAYGAFASYFDVCRVLRNELSYNAADVVTEAELDELVAVVKQFARLVAAWLAARHPELR